jgi:3'(2'), 5'-bisphosphate nucleotidase
VSDLSHELEVAIGAARTASELVMSVYASGFAVEYKTADDPVTVADKRANAAIVATLGAAFPNDAIVAEESDNDVASTGKERCWFVDPLDGTREFVARNGEFCVMIGLAIGGLARLGVIAIPAWKSPPFLLAGIVGAGCLRIDEDDRRSPVDCSAHAEVAGARVVVSRSRFDPALAARLGSLGARPATLGSGGVKAAALLVGEADAYVHPASRDGRGCASKWDVCAPEAIVRAAGGVFTDASGLALRYDGPELLARRGQLAAGSALHRALVPIVRD